MENSLKFNFTTHLDSFKLQAQSEFHNGINALWGKIWKWENHIFQFFIGIFKYN